jgi:hypothetical protein
MHGKPLCLTGRVERKKNQVRSEAGATFIIVGRYQAIMLRNQICWYVGSVIPYLKANNHKQMFYCVNLYPSI